MTRYYNQLNQHTKSLSLPVEFITCLVFGTLYFIYRGMWGHAVLSLIMALATNGLPWLVYPLFISPILHDHHINKGWVSVD